MINKIKNKLLQENGFTLVEILLSLVLIVIVVTGFGIGFLTLVKTRTFNESRLAASNVAKSVLEEVRYDVIAGEYGEIGTTDGNPSGSLERTKTIEKNGRDFSVNTRVWWEDENVSGYDVYNAYKRIKVTVEEINREPSPPVTFSTYVTKESELETDHTGFIKVETERRNQLQPGVFMTLSSSSVLQTGTTDSEGKKIFSDMEPDNYTIELDPDHNGIMLEPTGINGSYPSITWNTDPDKAIDLEEHDRENVIFQVDWPAYLDLSFVTGNNETIFDYYPNDVTMTIEIREASDDEDPLYQFSSTLSSSSELDPMGGIRLWPRYIYDVILEDNNNSMTYTLSEDNNESWTGGYPDSESAQTKDLDLVVAASVEANPTPDDDSDDVEAGDEITLSSDPSGFNIYYTTDGSTPDQFSTEYSDTNKPVVPIDDTPIKARAYKSGYLLGPVCEFVYDSDD